MNAENVGFKISGAQAREIALQVAASFDEAWNSRDSGAIARLLQEQADFQFQTGKMIRSRDEIERYYAQNVFPGLSEGLRHKVTLQHARFIREDVAIGDGKVEVYDSTEPDVQKRVRLRTFCTGVIVEENGHWIFSAIRLMLPQK